MKTQIILLAAGLSLAACSKDSEPATKTAGEGDSLAAVMAPYEACRAKLAADDADVAGCAGKLAAAAKSANQAELASAAAGLGAMSGKDIGQVRMAFGKVSQMMVGMVGSAGDSARGYHVFECPMAEGYKRWVQTDPELANPYMGQKMPTCGSEIDHAAMREAMHGGMHEGMN